MLIENEDQQDASVGKVIVKPDTLNSNPGSHVVVEGENKLS